MQRNICVHILHKFNQILISHFFFHSYDDDDDDDDSVNYLNLKFPLLKFTEDDRFQMLLLFCFSQRVSYLVLTIPMFKIVGRELQLWKEKRK